MTTKNKFDIAIIGGGVTGLSSAWRLSQLLPDKQIIVLEKETEWGGKMITHQIDTPNGDHYTIDGGPESFVTRKPEVWDLAHELGIEGQIIEPGSETQNMFILHQGIPQPAPLSPIKFLTSSLLSWRGKLRMLAEPFISPRKDLEDESLAAFIDRRLGVEARKNFLGPILAGIYNTDPTQQSILTTSRVMREMEYEYGGLVRAILGRIFKKKEKTNSQSKPRFITFKNGSADLINALIAQLSAELLINTEVVNIEKNELGYLLKTNDNRTIQTTALVLATPANMAAKLLQSFTPTVAQELATIRHENIGTVTFVFDKNDLPSTLKINGLMIPRSENRQIDAITFTSKKLPQRAPHNQIMFRTFIGGGAPEMVTTPDEQLLANIQQEIVNLLGITAAPLHTSIFRWPKSFPRADVGHLDKVAAIESALPIGLFLTGSSYRGIGVPDCIKQANDCSFAVQNFFQKDS